MIKSFKRIFKENVKKACIFANSHYKTVKRWLLSPNVLKTAKKRVILQNNSGLLNQRRKGAAHDIFAGAEGNGYTTY